MKTEALCEMISTLAKQYGDAFYLLDSDRFRQNYMEFQTAFQAIYPAFHIAYSYKTNYCPRLCRIVNELGGYAEVVSDMEMELAFRIGVHPEKIIWNGPYKTEQSVMKLLLKGGTVNLDSVCELEMIQGIASRFPDKVLRLGIRCNFDISDGVTSRFGIDTGSEDFRLALHTIQKTRNLQLTGMQCHFASRKLETWFPRVKGMLGLIDEYLPTPQRIDLGGGIYGKMPVSLQQQFDTPIPTYAEYAEAVAPLFVEHFSGRREKPELLLEPGTALAGDCMFFAAKVVGIKEVRGKAIASLAGSIYNINPTLNTKNPPLTVVPMGAKRQSYSDLDFGGYTCIESDYLYRHYSGSLGVGDYTVFGNAGSYSLVLKPPFILPNFPVLDIGNGEAELIKRQERFDDLFHSFCC